MTKRDEVLDTAKKLMTGDRARAYGLDARGEFQKVAKLWSVVLGHEVSADQVLMCLIQLKITRAAKDSTRVDNWVDIAGYSALAAEVATGDKMFADIMEDLSNLAPVPVAIPEPVHATTSSVEIVMPPADIENDDDVVDDVKPGKRGR